MMEYDDYEFTEDGLDTAISFLEDWLETQPDWISRYPTLASLSVSCELDQSTEADDFDISQAISELYAAVNAKDGTLQLHVKVLLILSKRMERIMLRQRAAFA